MRLGQLLLALGLAGVLASACSTTGDDDDGEASDDALTATSGGEDEPIRVPQAGTTLLTLSQPRLVQALEETGLGFAVHFGKTGTLANGDLAKVAPLYKTIADDLSGDVDALRAKDPKLSTQVAHAVTRILDKGWLTTNDARFELTGVLNRLDRLVIGDGTTCGEVRFLYRLAYSRTRKQASSAEVSYSRLPVIANVVYEIPRTKPGELGECREAARAWTMPSGVKDATAYLDFLSSTLLDRSKLRFKQVELNAQVMRVPSETKTDMGGLAEYAFRIYGLVGGQPIAKPLENTPDVARIEADPALKEELAGYLREHVPQIDRGTIVLPEKFLAKKVSAFSTYGSARRVNKPFTRLFYDDKAKRAPALEAAGLGATTYVADTRGLVARLDDLTCTGCHQGGRSVAGFHFLGEDSLARSHVLNIARVGISPHLQEEAIRRREFVTKLAGGKELPTYRPASFAPASPDRRASRGAPCLTDESANAFKSSFACAAGLVCTSLAKNARLPVELGQCLPPTVPSKTSGGASGSSYAKDFAGLPCLSGTMTDDPVNPRRDSLSTTQFACRTEKGSATGYACSAPAIGVPGGLCTRLCGDGNVPRDGVNELCAYGGGKEFDECAGKNDFAKCLGTAIKASLREACDEQQPCREDYICQKFVKARATPPEAPVDGRGYCVPTYFLFQVRVDGHPNPTPL